MKGATKSSMAAAGGGQFLTWTCRLSSDAWITKAQGTSSWLPSTLNQDKKKSPPDDLASLSLPSFTPPSPSFEEATFNPAAKRGSIVFLPLPPHLSLVVPTKRPW